VTPALDPNEDMTYGQLLAVARAAGFRVVYDPVEHLASIGMPRGRKACRRPEVFRVVQQLCLWHGTPRLEEFHAFVALALAAEQPIHLTSQPPSPPPPRIGKDLLRPHS